MFTHQFHPRSLARLGALLLLALGLSQAAPQTQAAGLPTGAARAAGTALPGAPQGPRQAPLDVLYDQMDTPAQDSVLTMQYPPGSEAFNAEAADDFVVPAGQTWNIQEVEAQLIFNANNPLTTVQVAIYQNAGGQPGPAVVTRSYVPRISGPTDPHLKLWLAAPIVLPAGTYWLGLQGYSQNTALADWEWRDRAAVSGYVAQYRNPGDGWGTGCTTWNQRFLCLGGQLDQMFRLDGYLAGVPTATPVPPTSTPTPGSTPYASPTPCTTSFSDVGPADYFYTPVLYLACHSMVSGYGDGTFRPYAQTTRAQQVKIAVLGFGLTGGPLPPYGFTFADVPTTNPFWPVIETAVTNGMVNGYACGGPGEACDAHNRPYFRPYASVTRGQLAKMLVLAAQWTVHAPATPRFADVPAGSPFYPFVETAACYGVISGYGCGGPGEPCDPQSRPYFRQAANATRGQISKIVFLSITTDPTCVPLK